MGMETMLIIAAVAALTATLLVGSMSCAVYGLAKANSRLYREDRAVNEASVKARRAARRRAASRKQATRRPAVAARRAVDDGARHVAF